MKFEEIYDNDGFFRNMRKTPWLKLFPHWWSEKDPLLIAIGDEIEKIKASAIFGLLNAGMKPPVMIWQESLKHEKYNINQDITSLPSVIEIPAPLYKTWGDITLTNNTDNDIDGLEIILNDDDGYIINDTIIKDDIIKINLNENKVQINNHTIKPQIIGKGMPYFFTTQNNKIYKEDTPLHNEVIRLKINTDTNLEGTIVTNEINVTEKMENWTIDGDAYQYNQKGADPWIAIENDSKISYEMDFTNITEISFWYKGESNGTLTCKAGNHHIFTKNIEDNLWHNYTIDTKNIESNEIINYDEVNETEVTITSLVGEGSLEFIVSNTEDIIYINDIKYEEKTFYNTVCDINVDINLNDAVFINEQNIEVTGLELIPIEKIELYANYNFPYNSSRNGWQKVYQKKYDSNTNVIYDMITTHFFTKEFYVDVWFKTLQYPYRIGFPCYQDADITSEFHVNNRLDTWGQQLGLKRRLYKKDIDEKDYSNTFPIYYPYDIEQDYWYYKRLVNEYTWNDLAINDVDIQDTEGNNILKLYSINPFCEDFVVHAQSYYPTDKEFIDYNEYYPIIIKQQKKDGYIVQSEYNNIVNLLGNTDYYSSITLNNDSDNNDIIYKQEESRYRQINNIDKEAILTSNQINEIEKSVRLNRAYMNSAGHISKELLTFFDLTDLPENVNIDDITITVEAESTDNKTNKFSTEDTGLVIPSLDGEEEYFIPLSADKNYQLRKQSITYSINDSTTLQKIISKVDENIIQKATIGTFEGRIHDYIKIPFTLTENGSNVDDITEVWIYFNNVLKTGYIEKDENNNQYIKVSVPNQAIISTIKIICKSETHMPFSTVIDVNKLNAYKQTSDEESEKEVDYQYISGPLIEGEPQTIEIQEEWHTQDIRNILQRQGIYFKNTFQNNDQQSSTTILLYKIKLTIHYSQKDSHFHLKTHINTHDAIKPNIGIYEIEMENTGEKPLKTSIDIITPPNIKMEQNYIDVNLNVNEGFKKAINIVPEYPIIDGIYDILTFCNDVVEQNTISVFSDGLIRTSVNIQSHNGKYNEEIHLSAEVYAVDKSKIHGNINQMQFYINGYAVGNPVSIYNNKAETTIIPGDYKFTGTGTLKLGARYLGSTKYASSYGENSIFIGKNNTKMTITASEKAIYYGTYEAKAIVQYYDGKEYKPVNDGYVTFYIKNNNNEEILGTAINNDDNGTFIASINRVENPPGEYELIAKYEGSTQFSSVQEIQNLEIIGGNVKILAFNETVRPHQLTKLRAKVLDKNNKNVPFGYLDFKNEELGINIVNVPVVDGIGTTEEVEINSTLNDDDASKIYEIEILYHGIKQDNKEIYKDAKTIGYITVKKGEVIIEYSSLYQASQYEPLGFFLTVKDAETKECVTEGTIIITLPGQNNLKLQSNIDEDGGVRIVHNLINFTAKEWQELQKWSFSTGNDNSLNQKNIINNRNISDFDGVYDSDNLYKIYDGNYDDITLVDFSLQNGDLIYEGKQRNDDDIIDVKEYVFIGDDGCLYARTDIDELRKYITGLQDINIKYQSNGGYKTQVININNGLNINTQDIDLDIHSYDLTYEDTDIITCYATAYSNKRGNILINDGAVQFILDNKIIDTVNISNGKAFLNNNLLTDIKAGQHLLEVDYIKNNNTTTRSYSLLNLRQKIPIVTINIDRVVRNKNTIITVNIDGGVNNTISLNGIVDLYLEHDGIKEKIGEQYLYGNEKLSGIVDLEQNISDDLINYIPSVRFNYIMPEDVDTPEKYKLIAVYEGNEYFSEASSSYLPIQEEPEDVVIRSKDVNIEKDIKIAANEECTIDFIIESFDNEINEGTLYLIAGTDIITSGNIVNNKVTLSWTPEEIKKYSFKLEYDNAIHYKKTNTTINFDVIEAVNEIFLPSNDYETLKQALMCIKTDGFIYLDNDIELDKSLIIRKNCNIIGSNDVCIINVSDEPISIINNNKVHIDNIHFISNNNKMQIINKKYLVINRSILDENVQLHNDDYLIAQRNFIYGTCTGNKSDLNNNWWGTNTPKYNVDSNIIIKVEPLITPAVISEEINIVGKMIGSNGREYILPEANFAFGADTGYFSIDSGKTINHEIKTKYIDAEKEGYVYFTVDNETVLCPVYEYERKTEVIIDELTEIPLNYQIPITAKVQSCADLYYDFDDNNDIINSTKTINEGYMSFYIDNQQVGYVPVKNGQATTTIFFTNKYYQNSEYQLKVKYIPKDYYFESENFITFSVIDDINVCYVSQTGDDNNDGGYNNPVKTIQHAVELQKDVIYLLDDNYFEKNININYNTIIKSFKNHSTFEALSGDYLFNIKSDTLLRCVNIDFLNNQLNTIFKNQGILQLNKCILYNNEKVIDNSNEVDIQYSAIVNNKKIANNIDASWFKYCWFGENNPDIDNIDNHIQMNIKSSKNELYIGALAHITGLLDTYRHGDFIYKIEEKLPLRIAKFMTTYGSMKPLKDYTYNNSSNSLLNTQENNNTSRYIVSILENKNYINDKITLSCSIKNVYGENASGKVNMEISGDNTDKIQRIAQINDGVATINLSGLNLGTYILTCSYVDSSNINNVKRYTSSKKFIVQKPEIIVKNFNILEGDNLYYLILNAELEDNFGNKINNQNVNVKIDDEYITSLKIQDGVINKKIIYNNIPKGKHILSIDTYDIDSEYSLFNYSEPFNTNMKHINTEKEIIFNYDNFEVGTQNRVNIYIKDDEGNKITGGYVTVEVDNNIILSKEEVIDGNIFIKNLFFKDIGQHTISIYYSGLPNYYHEALFINNYIGVGIFNVIFGLNENEYIKADIGKPLNLSTTIKDIGEQAVNHGYVNIYIDDILLNENPIYINNGILNIQSDLPENITSGLHNFKIEYIDVTHTYLTTFFTTFLNIGKIPTTINIDTIYGAPGQHTLVDYQISTTYGSVNSGILIAKYEGNIIGTSTVTDNILNQINIEIPFLPDTDDYDITFEYSDDYYYANSNSISKLIIRKDNVNIQPSHTQYYPNQTLHFVATITDNENHIINNGQVTLYIDNVQEIEPKDVINGQVSIPLLFNHARKYPMTIVYEDNDYYNETKYSFTFNVNSIDIDEIFLKENNEHKPLYYIDENHLLHSLPNQNIEAELSFITLDNYNVKDGIIDIIIDNVIVNSYYIAESNKYINFNTNNLSKGKHVLKLKYHDSSLFNNYEKSFEFDIISKQIQLKINCENNTIIAQNHTDNIEIRTLLYNNNIPVSTTGLINYYIGLPIYKSDEIGNTIVESYDYHFIGIKEINNTNEDVYLYKLPTNLLEYAADKNETQYKIRVTFEGNDEYDSASTEAYLHIKKENCNILFENMGDYTEENNDLIYNSFLETNYREIINFNFNINVQGTPLINFYIDDELIGSTVISNQEGSFNYKLDNKYTVKQGTDYYLLRASFNGSAVDNPTNTYIKIHINPLMPRFNDDNKIAYYGGVLKLDNIITDIDNTIINDGTLTYTIGNNIKQYRVNTTGQIDIPYTKEESLNLNIIYDTENPNYSVFEKNIQVNLIRNDVILTIISPDKIYRGENYNIVVKGISKTTNLPVNIPINDANMEDGEITIPINYLPSQSYTQSYKFIASSEGNQFFNPVEKETTIEIINHDTITLNKDEPLSKTNAQTLEKAIDLVEEYGTIKVINPPSNQIVTLNKGITIEGNNIDVTNWQITNNAPETLIEGLNFKNSTSNAIINNGDMIINQCTFENGKDSAVYNNKSIDVLNCNFINNSAENGAGIYIDNRNNKTLINNCIFESNLCIRNVNSNSGNGSCIYLNKGNDVEISDNIFRYNNGEPGITSSIWVTGNVNINSNSFYGNNYECEIYLVNGTLLMDYNIFDGAIQSVKGYNSSSKIDADLNYWGYNNIEQIESNNSDLITLNNWLISRREDYKREINNQSIEIVVGIIDQYENRFEKEITTINKIDKDFPVTVGEAPTRIFNLNEEIKVTSLTFITIGQEQINKVN